MSAEDFLNSPKAQKILEKHNKTVEKRWKKRQADRRIDAANNQFIPLPKIPPPMLNGLIIQQPKPIRIPLDPVRLAEIETEKRAAHVAHAEARKAFEVKMEPHCQRQRRIAKMNS